MIEFTERGFLFNIYARRIRFPLMGDKPRNVRPLHPSLHLARIGRPVRADAAGAQLAAALQQVDLTSWRAQSAAMYPASGHLLRP